MYYLDTNTCIYYLNGRYESIKKKLLTTPPSEIAVPVIVKAELLLGAIKSKAKKPTLEKIEKFLMPFEFVPFDDGASHAYAEIRGKLESEGKIIGPNDLLIAAIVKFHDGILITNNGKEFDRIKGLKIDNWIEE